MHTEFTPLTATAGGILIGLAAAAMLLFNGRIAGISGILGGFVDGTGDERRWRGWFLLGLVLGGLALKLALPSALPGAAIESIPVVITAGLLVGIGTRMGGGCTSGHGVCGISRLSTRSLVATAVFMAAGVITTGITRHLLGLGGAG